MRHALQQLAVGVAVWLLGAPGARAEAGQGDPFAGDRLYQSVVRYASLGEHRTATYVDHRTHDWLSTRLRELGFDVALTPFGTRQFYPTETSVTVAGKPKLEAFPVWHPAPTNGPITAKVTTDLADVAGKIYLFDNPSGTVNQAVQRTILQAAANGARAVIDVVTASQEVYGQNAQQQLSYEPGADPGAGDQTPWPVPVVTVGAKDRPALQEAIAGAREVEVSSVGTADTKVSSYILTATLGRASADKTLLVSTPVSGWFQAAGERGTGVAVWLALAEWAAKAKAPGVRWIFLATSGHELNFRGTHAYLKSDRIPRPQDVYLWTHLGANLSTYAYVQNADGSHTRTSQPASQAVKYLGADAAILETLSATFLPANNPAARALNITGLQNTIEGGDLFYAKHFGYERLLYFAGPNPKFHTRHDGPETTGPELLEPIARLIKSALAQLIRPR